MEITLKWKKKTALLTCLQIGQKWTASHTTNKKDTARCLRALQTLPIRSSHHEPQWLPHLSLGISWVLFQDPPGSIKIDKWLSPLCRIDWNVSTSVLPEKLNSIHAVFKRGRELGRTYVPKVCTHSVLMHFVPDYSACVGMWSYGCSTAHLRGLFGFSNTARSWNFTVQLIEQFTKK